MPLDAVDSRRSSIAAFARQACFALRRSVLAVGALALAAMLAGCAGLPIDPQRRDSRALSADVDGSIGKAMFATQPDPLSSGFRLLPSGPHALAARLELVKHARRSIDLQYFIVQADQTGSELLRLLRDAAGRGVRVRLLVDDLYTSGTQEMLSGLASFANAEVRVFNPFVSRRAGVAGRFAAQPWSFERLNHRMHNKLFAVDGIVAITGGRNIGDEYFSRRDAGNFIDLDVLAAGPIVQQMEAQFDRFWNNPLAVSILATRNLPADAEASRRRFDELTQAPNTTAAQREAETDALGNTSPAEQLRAGRLELAWGLAEFYSDPPGKGVDRDDGASEYGANLIRMNAVERIASADHEVLLASPYFVPGESGMQLLSTVASRGVGVTVLTNSLASTDQPLVHSAYRRYREALVGAGIRLYELSPPFAAREDRRKFFGLSAAGLHTKCLVIDRQELFIGSMNFDPRSDHYNTENGMAIHVPRIARDAALLLEQANNQAANRVQRGRDGHLEWIVPVGDEQYVHDREPDASVLRRLWLWFVSPFAPEGLL